MASLAYAAASAIELASGPSMTASSSGGSCWLRARRWTTVRAFCVPASAWDAIVVGGRVVAALSWTTAMPAVSVGAPLDTAAPVGSVMALIPPAASVRIGLFLGL